MADNTTLNSGTGGDVIATDDVTTLNGSASSGVKVQRTKVGWGADGTYTDVSATAPMPVEITDAAGNSADVLNYGAGFALEVAQAGVDYISSTLNSSTTQLAASATFTGTIESAFNQPNISLLMTSDQPITVTIQQFIDAGGTRPLPQIVFTSQTSISRSLTLNGNYVKITAQNVGASTTTTFNLNVAYGSIPNANASGEITFDLTSVGGVAIVDQTKGSQAGSFLPIQPARDTGRTHIQLWASAAAAGATGVETAITLTRSPSPGSATTTGTSWTVTSGKTFRITSIVFGSRGNTTATAQVSNFSIRVNTGGAVTTTSPALITAGTATPSTALAWDRYVVPLPDGLEITGTGTLQFGVTAAATFTTNAPTWYCTITGFEY